MIEKLLSTESMTEVELKSMFHELGVLLTSEASREDVESRVVVIEMPTLCLLLDTLVHALQEGKITDVIIMDIILNLMASYKDTMSDGIESLTQTLH